MTQLPKFACVAATPMSAADAIDRAVGRGDRPETIFRTVAGLADVYSAMLRPPGSVVEIRLAVQDATGHAAYTARQGLNE